MPTSASREPGVSGNATGQDHAAAQAMFEQMFGVGADNAPRRKKRIIGGALFVDERGEFFQRSWNPEDVEDMRVEMTRGLVDAAVAEHKMTAPLPHGVAWEVRLVETDPTTQTVIVTLSAEDEDKDKTSPPLRVQRTFPLPAGTTFPMLDVSVDEFGAVLSVTAKQEGAHIEADRPRSEGPSPVDCTVDMLDADLPPAFAIGEEPAKASEPGAKPNRAARRRAKQEGLKAGFLNGTKSKSSSGKSV